MKNLEGKVAFITGGVSGIGLGIARALAEAGMKLIVTYHRRSRLDEGLAQLHESARSAGVEALQLDVTDRDAFARVVNQVRLRHEKIHLLCNSAGVITFGAADSATYDDWDWTMGVNLNGVINALTNVIPVMKAHGEGGQIVNVASMFAFIPFPDTVAYTTSKFAVRGLTECLRYTLAPCGIGVSLLSPGLCRTRLHESFQGRPAHLPDTRARSDASFIKELDDVYARGMDPRRVGKKLVAGILRNDQYIFTHSECRDEVGDLCKQIVDSFPDEPPDPGCLAVETRRREAMARIRQQYCL